MRKDPLKRAFDILAAKYYLLFLQEHFRERNLGRLEYRLTGKRENNYFYRYMKGRPIKNPELVNHIEAQVKGSARILSHPVWLILANPDATLEDIHDYMKTLSFDIQKLLFKNDPDTQELIRKPHNDPNLISKIVIRGDLDALAAILMITREMELLGRLDPYIDAKWGAFHCLYILSLDFPFYQICGTVYNYVHEVFLARHELIKSYYSNKDIALLSKVYGSPVKEEYFTCHAQVHSAILYHAEIRGLVPDNPKDKFKFLYITLLNHDALEIEKQLKALPYEKDFILDLDELPDSLYDVINRTWEDGRHRLKRRSNYFN